MAKRRLKITKGQRFSRLKVLHEGAPYIQPSGRAERVFKLVCDCGKEVSVRLGSLRAGSTRSCGCLRKEINKKHGESYTRLYRCWKGMKERAKNREDCSVYKPWLDFPTFKKWAKSSGYNDSLILCRNGDKGNYEPDNCRWATVQDNVEEAHAKAYTLTYPCGKVEEVFNLSKFSKERGYSSGGLSEAASGVKPFYKGIKVEYKY